MGRDALKPTAIVWGRNGGRSDVGEKREEDCACQQSGCRARLDEQT